ncbi:hypothetical protein [Nitrosomonas sp.]|uniref:hypothetical protein n=1 Tax=Nitrosomonas sp. TaxID=42353 RepID=UPI0025F1BDAB|nr:hypothetical protein [Nitrosomonas sp.]
MKQSRNKGDNRSDSPPRPPAAFTPPPRGIGLSCRLRFLARTVIEWDVNTQTRTIFVRLRARSNPTAMVAKILDGYGPLGFAVTGVMLMHKGGANAISVFANAVRHEAIQKQR